jgi:PPM family protein phosphatase
MEEKKNCWEIMKCGREKDKASGIDPCPVFLNKDLRSHNEGEYAGRVCWLVAGTFCKGELQGSFAQKQSSCKSCEFYKYVHDQVIITELSTKSCKAFANSHKGLVRKSNEDRYLMKTLSDGSVLISIADGLGGEVAGDYAAEIITGKIAGISSITKDREEEELSKIAIAADLAMAREKESTQEELEGMGTTLVSILLRDHIVYWTHVGDSRMYHFADSTLKQITIDQTFARFLVEEGEITEEEAKTHYSRKVMDQCIGFGDCVPETGNFPVQKDDIVILSTDGLHKKITHQEFSDILRKNNSLKDKANLLTDAAINSGGSDNITLILCKIK